MFITLEGMEGVGKTTLAKKLKTVFDANGIDSILTREPGDTPIGFQIRSVLLNSESHLDKSTELMLFLADRAQHVSEVILPALSSGKSVISDRYADSTIVYQGYGRGFDTDFLYKLNDFVCRGLWPDITFILDVPPEVGLMRARNRNAECGMELSEGRFEAEKLSFHRNIREGFLSFAKEHADRCRVIDASDSLDNVYMQIYQQVNPLLSSKGKK